MDLSPLQKLGREVREASDEAATPEETIEAAKRGALAGWKRRSPPTRRPVVFALVAAALLAIAAFAFVPGRPAVTYVVGASAAPGALGSWISAGAEANELRFSEGTRITLAPQTRARVTEADENGARVVLEGGSVHANVVHTSDATSWSVHAGPFEIRVVGTTFDVAWDPTREVLVLGMIEGKVVVRGPLLGEGRTLERGEELRVEAQAKRSEVRVTSTRAEAPRPEEPRPAEPVKPEEPPAAEEAPATAAPPHASADKPGVAPSWRALAAAGQHREAMQAVEREGFEQVLAASPADILLELADEARFAGHYAQAEKALLRARSLGARGRSAFLLGKLAADHQGKPAEAAAWFERYLAEAPSGGLAEQALGRLLELRRGLGDQAGARAAAELYLQRWPRGAYAELARVVAGP